MLIVLIAISIAGALLVGAGLKREVVRLPERCGRCGFDLSGFVGARDAVKHCPECGADLSLGHALAAGEKVRVRLTMAGWMGCALVALAALVLLVHLGLLAMGRGDDFTPQWRLEQRAMRDDERALRELIERVAARQVDPARARRLVDAGIEGQERIAAAGFIHTPWLFEPIPPEMYWPELLSAALAAGYASPDQVARIVERGFVVSVYVGEQGSLYVQVVCLLGPDAAGLVDVTVEEWTVGAVRRREARLPGVHGWSWRIERAAEAGDAAHIHWIIDADAVIEALGVSVLPGRVSGEARIDWPEVTGRGDGRSPLLRRWWLADLR